MTNNIDEILNKPYVAHGEFKVPDGYFDALQQRIMDKACSPSVASITKHEAKDEAKVTRRPLIISMTAKAKYAVAACLTALIVCGGAYTYNRYQQKENIAAAPTPVEQTYTTDDYTQQCMDYAMVDDGDVYEYLADKDL